MGEEGQFYPSSCYYMRCGDFTSVKKVAEHTTKGHVFQNYKLHHKAYFPPSRTFSLLSSSFTTANFRLTLYPLQAACIRLADVSRKSFKQNVNLSVNTLQLIKLHK